MAFEYKKKDDNKLKQVAVDLLEGRVFSSTWVKNVRDVGLVFMPLALLSAEDRGWMLAQNIVFFYEYLEKASPKSINDMPIFFSCEMLNREDYDRMMAYMKELSKVLEDNENKLKATMDDM